MRGSELTGNPQEREVSDCRVSLYCHKQSGPDQMEAGGVFSKHRLQRFGRKIEVDTHTETPIKKK